MATTALVTASPQAGPTTDSSATPFKSPPKQASYTANFPFNNAHRDADAILQTADMAKFYIHRAVLRIASSFFADMLSLPQPASSDSDSHNESALPVIHISENADTIDRLLRICYPVAKPCFFGVAFLSPILGAAIKYQMTEAIAVLTKELLSSCDSDPLQVFAVACRHNLEGAVLQAAAAFCVLKQEQRPCPATGRYRVPRPIAEYTELMDTVSASAYYQLLQFHTKRASATSVFAVPTPKFCLPLAPNRPSIPSGNQEQAPAPFDDTNHGDTVLYSSDGVKFYVHRNFLAFASPVLRERLALPPDAARSTCEHRVSIAEHGSILALLLPLCYPMADPAMPTRSSHDDRIHDACSLLDAARKYKVTRAEEFAKRMCIIAAESFPLRLYLIASHYGWDNMIEQFALRAVYELADSDAHVPEMDVVSAGPYRRILVYRQKCRNVILSKWHGGNAPQAQYWSQEPWRAQEQAARDPPASLNVESVLPSSTSQEAPAAVPGVFGQVGPPVFVVGGGSAFGRSLPADAKKDTGAAKDAVTVSKRSLSLRQQTILKIAEELVKGRHPVALSMVAYARRQQHGIDFVAILNSASSSMSIPSTPVDPDASATHSESLSTESSLAIANGDGPATTENVEVKTADTPFNNPYGDADVILRSSDAVDFYAHKAILRISSTGPGPAPAFRSIVTERGRYASTLNNGEGAFSM
ncbi:uncharacterized protein C8Q71DRAFT_897968 [Rhodofomes roseus]|uniref:BTB domain-containing protein n=1 Tax=Rhodofomes roseus TaxID=34475 RepID=A0ABQ8KI51_9APHY|nr:uncharacterized protein C8Q71DRAFT_897968 [Rhodofomes roseus]KAH9837634.1 hypothetical protein C8Q71DRAFT_897968 [Rhodofomes roseus]